MKREVLCSGPSLAAQVEGGQAAVPVWQQAGLPGQKLNVGVGSGYQPVLIACLTGMLRCAMIHIFCYVNGIHIS